MCRLSIFCVLVERKAQNLHAGATAHRTSLDQMLAQHKCTDIDKMNRNYFQFPFYTLQGPSFIQGPPMSLLSWSRAGLVTGWVGDETGRFGSGLVGLGWVGLG